MKASWRCLLAIILYGGCLPLLWAGGSGLNVVVVVNQNSADSVELGNYYCEKRHVPPENILRINWNGGIAVWNNADFTNYLLNPLLTMLADRQLTHQVHYVVLSMAIPYRVVQGGGTATAGCNSTTAVLYYGFKPDGPGAPEGYPSCNLPDVSSNSYAGSEAIFRDSPPLGAPTNSFLAMMITSSNLTQAKAIVDHGVLSDSTFPIQPVVLAKSFDTFRNIRHLAFDNAIFNTRLIGDYSMFRTNSGSPYGVTNMLGYETGLDVFSILPNAFVPGAIADSLTSTAGVLYEANNQTTLLAFLDAGATASYGTVIEPCAYFEKFPSPQIYFYQARGFSLAECYYQGVTNPFQGIMVGEPLAAPFERPAAGSWLSLETNGLLTDLTNLAVQFDAIDSSHPIDQVDLFVDGKRQQTLTNLAPTVGNVLTVNLNGHPITYPVPVGATISSIANGLTAAINLPINTLATKVSAFTHGDRIELQSTDISKPGAQVTLSANSSSGVGGALTTHISAQSEEFLDTIAYGLGSFLIEGNPNGATVLTTNSYLQCVITKLNSSPITLGVTNTSGTNTLVQMAVQLFYKINGTAALQAADGLHAQDSMINYSPPPDVFLFNLVPNSPGWSASQISAILTGSPEFTIQGSATGKLDDNVNDLRPRNDLYVTAGVAHLPVTFSVDTTALADGFHELTAVAYEGSHVRTESRVTSAVRVQNTPLSASLTLESGGTNVDLDATLTLNVVANTNNIDSIQLFSTGGLISNVLNQSSATIPVSAVGLGAGLHPFYALVTASGGAQFRTETIWVRVNRPAPAFPLTITAPPPTLSWPATVGQNYHIMATTNLADPFQVIATVTATNSTAAWLDTNAVFSERFYRVQTAN